MKRTLQILLGITVVASVIIAWMLTGGDPRVAFIWQDRAAAPEEFGADAHRQPKDLNYRIRQLQSDDEFVRAAGAQALADLGLDAQLAVPDLIKALTSRQPLRAPFTGGILTWWDHSPLAARKALVQIGAAAIPALEEALDNKDALTRVHAAAAHWDIKRETRSVLPVLLKVWRDRTHDTDDLCIRRAATEAIGKIAQAEPDHLLKVTTIALDQDAELGYEVARVLTILGEKDRRAVEHLFKLMGTEGDNLYRFAAFGLRELKAAGVPLLIDGLKSDNAELRWRCAWALGGMKSTYVGPAIPALMCCLKDDSEMVRQWANWALQCIEKRSFDNRYD